MKRLEDYSVHLLIISVVLIVFMGTTAFMIYGMDWSGAQVGNIMCFNLNDEGNSRLRTGVHEVGHYIYKTCLNESMIERNSALFDKYRTGTEGTLLPNRFDTRSEFFARMYASAHMDTQYSELPIEVQTFQQEVMESCP